MTTEFEKKKQRHASGESNISTDSVSNYIPTPPDGGYGWVIVLASFINHVIVDGISFTFGVFYIEFLKYFKESKGRTALVGSLLCGVYLLTGPVAGALTNKYGCRPICMVGGVIAACAFVLSTFSTNITMLMLTYGVMGGFGFGLVYLPSVISVSFYFEKRRALATGIAVCGAGVGCFLFAPIGGLLVESFDWKKAMWIVAAVVLISVVCGMFMVPLEPPKHRRKPRAKNLLDRFMERCRRRTDTRRHDSISSNTIYKVQLVQQVKLAREQRLRNDDSESEMGSMAIAPPLRVDWSEPPVNGDVGKTTTLPRIVVGSYTPNGLEEGHGEDDAGIFLSPSTEQVPTAAPLRYALPSHMVAEMTNGGNAAHLNRSLPNVLANGVTSLADETDSNDVIKSRSTNELGANGIHKHPHVHHRRPKGILKEDYARPLYRKDIFYSGSVMHITEFRSQPDVRSYVRSITSIPRDNEPEQESFIWRCLRVPKVAKHVLQDMLDLSLFKNPIFIVVCLGNVFGMIGLYVPFVYLVDKAMIMGVSESHAVFLISVIGITNTLGRVVVGWLSDFKWVNSLLVHNVAVVCAGAVCILNMFCSTYPLMCVFAASFGLCIATYISLTSIILCEMIGIDKLTNAFGLLAMARGVSVIAGPPIAGFVYDVTNNYDDSFNVGGFMLILAGLMFCLLHLPYFQRLQHKNQQEMPYIVEPTTESLLASGDEKLVVGNGVVAV